MELTDLEKHVLTRNLSYRGGVGSVIYFATVIRDEVVIVYYDIVSHNLLNIVCTQELSSNDVEFLKQAIVKAIYAQNII